VTILEALRDPNLLGRHFLRKVDLAILDTPTLMQGRKPSKERRGD
jgi:hypothetical protein